MSQFMNSHSVSHSLSKVGIELLGQLKIKMTHLCGEVDVVVELVAVLCSK